MLSRPYLPRIPDDSVIVTDRVAVLAMNCVEYLDVWFACGKLGAILQTLNWRLTPAELTGLIEDATPRVLVYGPDFGAQVEEIRERMAGTRLMPAHVVALGDPIYVRQGDLAFGERDEYPDTPPEPVELNWDDPWAGSEPGPPSGSRSRSGPGSRSTSRPRGSRQEILLLPLAVPAGEGRVGAPRQWRSRLDAATAPPRSAPPPGARRDRRTGPARRGSARARRWRGGRGRISGSTCPRWHFWNGQKAAINPRSSPAPAAISAAVPEGANGLGR